MPKIGPYNLHTVDAGRFRLDGGAMFGIIPKTLWNKYIEADNRNRIPLAMRCLLLEGDGRLILIDNGLGHKYDAKFADIFAVDHEHSTLAGSLNALGFSPKDVTDVVLTHLHFDHCGGSTGRDGDKLVLTFPNAIHHVQATHWEWACRSNSREKASFLDENLEPLAASGQIRKVDAAAGLVPGLEPIVVDGHTRAQQAVRIFDDSRSLVYVADLIPTSVHIPPVWCMAYDIEPMKSMAEKDAFLTQAVESRWHLFFEHDPLVEVLDLEQTEKGIRGTGARNLADL
ncbi:MAG TPA: MBL fold metallo-hydrolase [Rhodothermales bacterium]|nr:MBL fold metallo-hydrolase [Rhodothermales bacterium]